MKLIRWLDKNFELTILAVLLAVMSVLSFANVIMRYCFKSALSWSDEVCCYCLALSASPSIRYDSEMILASLSLRSADALPNIITPWSTTYP